MFSIYRIRIIALPALFTLSSSLACMKHKVNLEFAVLPFIDRHNKKTNVTIHNIDGRIERWDCQPLPTPDAGIALKGYDITNSPVTCIKIHKSGNVFISKPILSFAQTKTADPLVISDIKQQSGFVFLSGNESWDHAHITTIKGLHTFRYGLASVTVTLRHKEQ